MSRSCTWHANVCTWRRLVMFMEQFDPALQFLTTVQSRPRHAMPWFDSVMMKYWMYRKGLLCGRRRPARLSRCWCGYRISTRVYRISITQPISGAVRGLQYLTFFLDERHWVAWTITKESQITKCWLYRFLSNKQKIPINIILYWSSTINRANPDSGSVGTFLHFWPLNVAGQQNEFNQYISPPRNRKIEHPTN